MTPHDIFSAQLKWAALMVEAQSVAGLRIMAMTGLIPAHPGENTRMVIEKGPAMGKALAAASEAMMRGQTPTDIFNAAMVPLSHKVRSNRKRLSK